MDSTEKFNYITKTNVKKLVISLAIPTIISMLITSFYNMADTFFVGKINTQATAAVGVVFSFMALIQAIGFYFGHGSGNYISRMLGAKKRENAEKMAATGFFFAFLFGLMLTILGLIFIDPLSYFLGSTKTILPYTREYLKYILIGSPYMTASLVLNNQLRFQGNAFYAMIGITSGGILNLILDPLFIFTFHMGISGAAIATILSQFISFLLLLYGTLHEGNIRIKLKNFTPSLYYWKEIFRGGFPSLCRQGLASFATICLNLMAGVYGDAAIAGMSIVSRISMFSNSILIGFGQGFQPVCAFNYGAKKNERVLEAFWFCVKTGFLFLLAISVIGYIFAPELIEVFRKGDVEVTEIGIAALRFQSIVFPLNAWIVICNMMMQAIGKSFRATVLAASRQGLFFVPLIFILPKIFGLYGVEITQMLSDILTFILAIPIGVSVIKEIKSENLKV